MSDVREIVMESDAGNGMWLIYGGWGCGKTYSLGSLPGKTMIIVTEMKNINRVLGYAKGKYKIYPMAVIEDGKMRFRTFDELMEQLNEWVNQCYEGSKPFDNLAIDSLTALQNIFAERIEDDVCARRKEDGKNTEALLERFYMSRDAYTPLNSAMQRVTEMVQNFTMFGVNVIATAGIADVDEFTTKTEPHIIGKGYKKMLSGYWDFIGYVTENMDDDGNVTYPPVVRFRSNGTFKAKCGDSRLEGSGRLDFGKIFERLNSGE